MILRKKFSPILCTFIAIFFASACTSPTVSSIPNTLVISSTQSASTPTHPATNTLIPVTNTPLPTYTPRLFLTDTPKPFPTSTPTPSPDPSVSLTSRQPSLEELDAYLSSVFPDSFGIDPSIALTPEDLNGDGKMEFVHRYEIPNMISTALFYEDVNGDKEDDLVILFLHFIFVLLWDQDQYMNPYWRPETYFGRCSEPVMSISFEDWTGDKTPEIISEYRTSYGGTGLCSYETEKSVIHCNEDGCYEIWSRIVDRQIEDLNVGGLVRQHVDTQSFIDENNQPGIRALEEGFSVSCCSILVEGDYPTGILTSTLTLYTWTGTALEETDKQIVSLPRPFGIQPVLDVTNNNGVTASVSARYNFAAGDANDYCDLFIQGNLAGTRFGCQSNYTIVEWKDITGDAQEEVVVITYSAGYPLDNEGNLLGPETCMHQHLLAFQFDSQTATEIANVTGCVIRNDLFGVRLEDLDGDGNPEIIAAPNGELGHCAYKWNGTQFVFWSELPEP